MADYNVNMKQWNGTSFDNVLPLAYNSNKIDGKTWVQVTQLLLEKSGGTMTGDLILNGDPTVALQATPKQYVDEKINTGVTEGIKTIQKIEWTGNGAKTSSTSPMSITFDFPPLFLLLPVSDSHNNASPSFYSRIVRTDMLTTTFAKFDDFIFARGGTGGSYYETEVRSYVKKSDDGRTISWYNNETTSGENALNALNKSNVTYIAYGISSALLL